MNNSAKKFTGVNEHIHILLQCCVREDKDANKQYMYIVTSTNGHDCQTQSLVLYTVCDTCVTYVEERVGHAKPIPHLQTCILCVTILSINIG